jgi:hypothetical protein
VIEIDRGVQGAKGADRPHGLRPAVRLLRRRGLVVRATVDRPLGRGVHLALERLRFLHGRLCSAVDGWTTGRARREGMLTID